jgi:hypothetical protein
MTLAAHCADPAIAAHVIRPAAFAAGALRSPEEIAGEVKARLVASRRAEIRQVSPAPEATAPEATAPEAHAPEPHAIEPESPGLLRRPRLLARAAREGARMYRRERDLRTSLPGMTGPRKGVDIVSRLLGIEAQIEAERVSGAYSYSPMRHVGVLSALVAESLALAAKRAEG